MFEKNHATFRCNRSVERVVRVLRVLLIARAAIPAQIKSYNANEIFLHPEQRLVQYSRLLVGAEINCSP